MCVFKGTMVLIPYGTMQSNFGTVEKFPEIIIVNCIHEGDPWLGELIRSQGVVIYSCWDLLTAGGSCISCGHLKILSAAVTSTLCFSMVCRSRANETLGRILGFKTPMPKNFGLKIGCHKIWMEMCVS